jgi:hypothetical protein
MKNSIKIVRLAGSLDIVEGVVGSLHVLASIPSSPGSFLAHMR